MQDTKEAREKVRSHELGSNKGSKGKLKDTEIADVKKQKISIEIFLLGLLILNLNFVANFEVECF